MNYLIQKGFIHTVLDLSGGLGVPLNPQVCFDPPKKLVKISKKYIADPPLVFPQIRYCIHTTHTQVSEVSQSQLLHDIQVGTILFSEVLNNFIFCINLQLYFSDADIRSWQFEDASLDDPRLQRRHRWQPLARHRLAARWHILAHIHARLIKSIPLASSSLMTAMRFLWYNSCLYLSDIQIISKRSKISADFQVIWSRQSRSSEMNLHQNMHDFTRSTSSRKSCWQFCVLINFNGAQLPISLKHSVCCVVICWQDWQTHILYELFMWVFQPSTLDKLNWFFLFIELFSMYGMHNWSMIVCGGVEQWSVVYTQWCTLLSPSSHFGSPENMLYLLNMGWIWPELSKNLGKREI